MAVHQIDNEPYQGDQKHASAEYGCMFPGNRTQGIGKLFVELLAHVLSEFRDVVLCRDARERLSEG
jgi:hypothetical protein